MSSTCIYALCEPDTGEIRYLGKADNPRIRFTQHLRSREKSYRVNWIRELSARGLKPVLKILNRVPKNDWKDWERAYIRNARLLGMRLVNTADGGDGGGLKGRLRGPMREEQKEKLRQARLGKTLSKETREKISRAHLGKKLPPRSEDWRKHQSESQTGKHIGPRPPGFGEKIRWIQLGRKHTSDRINNIRKARLGQKPSLEVCQKMREGQLKRWEKIRIQNVLLELWR